MAASFSQATILGNVTRDPEVRYTQGGMAIAELSVACNERRKQASGEYIDEVSYFDVTCFGRTAEIAGEYLTKGSPVFVVGRLKQERWEKDGQKRSKVVVIAENLKLIGGKGGGGGSQQDDGGASERQHERSNSGPPQTDDIPF